MGYLFTLLQHFFRHASGQPFLSVSLMTVLMLFGPVAWGTARLETGPVLMAAGGHLLPGGQPVGGTVTDDKGNPLPGVTVKNEKTGEGTITDASGKFTLMTDEHAALEISFIGYQSVEVPVKGRKELRVSLRPQASGLNEVVVVGYGTQKKKDVTGAITSVDAHSLENRPLTNASQAIQGMNGLYVNQAGGQPGKDAATIRIRGIGTLNNNNPLVLVNGIEYDLQDVNPSDIQSISVLKDAAAAAIYGSRAANGVILITTKEGEKGTLQLRYSGYVGWQQATYLPDVVSSSVQYMKARNQASVDEGQPLVFSDEDIASYGQERNPDRYPNTNWFDLMFRRAFMVDHNIRLSGGSDRVLYNVSLDYLDQDGVLLATAAQRYSLNTSLHFNITKRLKAGINLLGTYWTRHEPAEGAASLVGDITRALPIQEPVLSNGRYADQRFLVPGHNVFRNPYAKALEGGLDTKSQRILVNAFAEYTLPFGIVYKINFAVNKYDAFQAKFVPQIDLYSPLNPDSATSVLRYDDPTSRSATRYDYNDLNTSFFQTLNWSKTIGSRHHLNLLLGYSRESIDSLDFSAYIEGFLGNQLKELNAGTINKDVSGTSSQSRLMSYFGRAGYNYADRYLLEFDFRADGSSRFAKNRRWGFFPSVAGAWEISNEPFITNNVAAINELKLRASWGRLGNQNLPLYSYLNAVDINQGYSFNNTIVSGSAVTTLSDPDITWETTTIANIGLDVDLWKGMLGFSADIYDKKTSNILARINVPAQVGDLNGPVTNLYSMSNKGLEINATHHHTLGRFSYHLNAGIAFNSNNVDYLNGDVQYSGNNSLYVIKEGYPVNSYYLYVAEGIFKTAAEVKDHANEGSPAAPGDLKYKDISGDGTIGSDDRIITGRTVPKYTYSFTIALSYLRFDLSAFFQGVEGVDMYPINNLAFPLYNGAGLTKDEYNDSWTPENPDAAYPRLGEPKRGSGLNYKNSTFWLRNGSYLRLKNILLGYNIPEGVCKRIGIQQAKLFVNAQNLLTFSPYKLTDPERNVMQDDLSEYPSVKTLTVGINVNF